MRYNLVIDAKLMKKPENSCRKGKEMKKMGA